MAQYGGVHARQTLAVATQTLQEALNTVPAPSPQQEIVTLILRPRKTVSWSVETVDNEHMQKKSSKICCVFHKKELEDSSDEDESCGCNREGKGHCHRPSEGNDDCGDGGKGKDRNHHHSSEVAESTGKSKE